eukprot:TRINITY_DN2670_c0_g1_i3.p1 TRINITY_DN2670_c0_g1~~TRINITY_DN2670_c0_g1_i3.p1  ORF type:complete len:225 (+),score=24.39 TRINITY_DN2670_c0_g1_i3:174-848(+)
MAIAPLADFVNGTEMLTYQMNFCARVDNILGNTTRTPDKKNWIGWYWGTMSSFSLISQNPLTFQQNYTLGDQGYPCRHSNGQRKAFVTVTAPPCPGSNSSRNAICSAYLDPVDECVVYVNAVYKFAVINAPPVPPGPGGWNAAGIFFFVVFMLALVGCIGGCIFNFSMGGKRGIDVIPLTGLMRKLYAKLVSREPSTSTYESDTTINASVEPTPPSDNARYGTL